MNDIYDLTHDKATGMQKHRVYKLNLNKFGRFMLCLASAIGMTYIWVEILLGLAGM